MLINGKEELRFVNTVLPKILRCCTSSASNLHTLNTGIKQALLNSTSQKEPSDARCRSCATYCAELSVFCSLCNRWSHYVCENLSQKEIKTAEEEPSIYKCTTCHTEPQDKELPTIRTMDKTMPMECQALQTSNKGLTLQASPLIQDPKDKSCTYCEQRPPDEPHTEVPHVDDPHNQEDQATLHSQDTSQT